MNTHKNICYIVLFFKCLACVLAFGDEFNFDNENLLLEQMKSIELTIPDFSKSPTGEISVYSIKIDSEGIIRSIVSKNNLVVLSVYKKGNRLIIKDNERNNTNIKYDNNSIYVRGKLNHSNNPTEFSQIKINPAKDIVYESSIKKLMRISDKSLEEINTDRRTLFIFSNNTNLIDFGKKGHHSFKYEFTKKGTLINVTYFDHAEEEYYIEYPSKIVIKLNDATIFSKDEVINVLNYLILYTLRISPSAIQILAVLFPVIFLEDWDTQNKNWQYTASSFLKEKNDLYTPGNLSVQGGLPWASANGYGIGEGIVIDMADTPSNKLLLINGFVSKEKPYLFKNNSRLRDIKITNTNTKRSKFISIQDTPEPQYLDITDLKPSKYTKLEIEILSVFRGDKYKDLCVQAILPN